jgi:hypothetical protein
MQIQQASGSCGIPGGTFGMRLCRPTRLSRPNPLLPHGIIDLSPVVEHPTNLDKDHTLSNFGVASFQAGKDQAPTAGSI